MKRLKDSLCQLLLEIVYVRIVKMRYFARKVVTSCDAGLLNVRGTDTSVGCVMARLILVKSLDTLKIVILMLQGAKEALINLWIDNWLKYSVVHQINN